LVWELLIDDTDPLLIKGRGIGKENTEKYKEEDGKHVRDKVEKQNSRFLSKRFSKVHGSRRDRSRYGLVLPYVSSCGGREGSH
jgi:hypothetical protein